MKMRIGIGEAAVRAPRQRADPKKIEAGLNRLAAARDQRVKGRSPVPNEPDQETAMFQAKRIALAAAALAMAAGSQAAQAAQPSLLGGLTVSQWTALHTVAPSHFSAPVTMYRPVVAAPAPSRSIFTAPATGPAGAQFGRLPATNNSFVNPTLNSVQARQTQNSVQATNTQMSSQAVQGRNCSLNAIRAGLCQGR
jgi:hypothetical protein